MPTAHINIGSNIGDRQAYISRAVAAVERLTGAQARVSPIVESEPWGYSSDAAYLNVGLALEWQGSPLQLLSLLQQAEKEIDGSPHRDASGHYIDRCIDIDLIALDDMVVDSEQLTLPHPRMHLRPFVLEPLAWLAPQWRHPSSRLTAAEMLQNL